MKLPEELMFLKNSKLPQHTSIKRFDGETVVISGATSGIGLATARRFAEFGANIIIVCRNLSKAEPIKSKLINQYNVKVDIVKADFSDFDSIREAAAYINEHFDFNYLINSAGLHSTRKRFNKDNIELVFSVNHLGTFLFTVLLLDKLKQNAPSRVIQVNSEGHRFSGVRPNDINFKRHIYTGLRSYGQSKTAQLMTNFELARRLEDTGVLINAMHPGAVKTNIGSNNGLLYRLFLKYVTGLTLKDVSIASSALHYLAKSDDIDSSGNFYNLTILEKPARHVFKKGIEQEVWDLTLKLTGLKDGDI